jgi:pilus assembly protein CpaB
MIKNLAIGSGSNKTLLIAALVFGVLAAVLIGVYLSSLDSSGGGGSSTASETTVPVVVAAQDIAAQTVVTEQMLTVKDVPLDVAVASAFSDTSAVVGQTTSVAVKANEQISPSKVTSVSSAVSQYGPNTPASLVVPKGMRGFGVLIGSLSGSTIIRPGDYVDIIDPKSVSTNSDTGQQVNLGSACYVVQDIQVLSLGSALLSPDASTNADSLAASPADPATHLMVLSVNPNDAALLAAAQQTPGDGSVEQPLWASLRPFGEHGQVSGVPVCQNVAQAQPAS